MPKEKKDGTIVPINFDDEAMELLVDTQYKRFKKNGYKGKQSYVALTNEAVKKAFKNDSKKH